MIARSRTVVLAAVFGPLLGLAALWTAALSLVDGADFEGPGLVPHLLLRGTLLDALGLVEPSGRVAYRIKAQDGTAPESASALYASLASPDEVVARYRGRCEAAALAAEAGEEAGEGGERTATLRCEGRRGAVRITAGPSGAGSAVTVLASEPLR